MLSACMLSAIFSSSVAVAGVPPMNLELEKVAAAGVVGTVGATLGGARGAAVGGAYGATLGAVAGPLGAVLGGMAGAVAGGAAGAATGYVGFVMIKALNNELKRR